MKELQRSPVFLEVLQKRPGRFALGAFLCALHFISGVTTNMAFYARGLSSYAARAALAETLSAEAFMGALLWQGWLTGAVLLCPRGGWGLFAAAAALCAESFVLGFAMSEALFYYGEPRALLLILCTALTGFGGLMLRGGCFVTPLPGRRSGRTEGSAYAVWKYSLCLAFLQGIVIPLLLLAD